MRDPTIKGKFNTFDCGKCKYCKENRRSQWSFRLQQELKKSANAYFYTLTYEDLYLPMEEDPPLSGSYVPTLRKDHLKSFIKRFRQARERREKVTQRKDYNDIAYQRPIRYFGCGEYGGIGGRPHYHVIIFNVPERHKINMAEKSWKYGSIHIGEVNDASIHYVTKYCLEQDQWALMSRGSKKPYKGKIYGPLGFEYLKDQEIYKHHANGNDNVQTDKGYNIPMPRIYKHGCAVQPGYINDSVNYNKLAIWDKVNGEEKIRFELKRSVEQERWEAHNKREDKRERRHVKANKNPIVSMPKEDYQRYENFGKSRKINTLD